MRAFLAGPFFTESENRFMREIQQTLVAAGYQVTTPLDIGYAKDGTEQLFQLDLETISNSEIIFAILDGQDEGTMAEIGFARGSKRTIIGIWTDQERRLDPFVRWLCDKVVNVGELKHLKLLETTGGEVS